MEAAGGGAQQFPPPQPNPAAQNLTNQPKMDCPTRKRKMPSVEFQNSCYFKIRSIVKELRPTFLEVIHAADFRDCKAAHDIQNKMKTILELYKQLNVEIAPPPKRQNTDHQEKVDAAAGQCNPCGPSLTKDDPEPVHASSKEMKPQARASNPVEVKVAAGTNDTEQQQQGAKESYVTGGSPIGWNFVICSDTEPVYYGLTKEAWRAKQITNSEDLKA